MYENSRVKNNRNSFEILTLLSCDVPRKSRVGKFKIRYRAIQRRLNLQFLLSYIRYPIFKHTLIKLSMKNLFVLFGVHNPCALIIPQIFGAMLANTLLEVF